MSPADGNEPIDDAAAAVEEAKHAAKKKFESVAATADAKLNEERAEARRSRYQPASSDGEYGDDSTDAGEPGVLGAAFEQAQRATAKNVAAVKGVYAGPDGNALLLSTTMVAVGSAMVGALVGWMMSSRR